MTPDEFRRHGHDLIEWLARYQSTVEQLPVLSPVEPGWVRAQLPPRAPEHGEPFADIVADLDRVILPGVTHWQHPSWFAYFPANNSGPSILGELVSAGLGVQGMLWQTSPAATELETHVLDWMVDLLGLPTAFHSTSTGGGVIQDSASSAALCALVAARERSTAGQSNRDGVRAPLIAYATGQAHSSIEKAVRIAGLGSDNLRSVPTRADREFEARGTSAENGLAPRGTDREFEARGTSAENGLAPRGTDLSMSPEALEELIRADLDAGLRPCFVAATIGTTATNAMDPLPEIAEICARYGIWLHVDAAMSGSAALCPEFRHFQQGLDGADSYCVNPHKWLLTNFDCDLFYVRDRAALIGALSILPEFLRNPASTAGAVIDYRDWQVPLGRRFRSLKLWFVLRSFGAEALRAMVRRHVEAAQWFAAMVEKSAEFTLAAPAPLNLVCIAHVAGDAATQHVLDTVNASGQAYLSHAKVNDRLVIRLSVGQERTEHRHVEAVWNQLLAAARSYTGQSPAPASSPLGPPSALEEPGAGAGLISSFRGAPRTSAPHGARLVAAVVLAVVSLTGLIVAGNLWGVLASPSRVSPVDDPKLIVFDAMLAAAAGVVGAGVAAVAVSRRWARGWWFAVPLAVIASACYAVWTVLPTI